VGALRWRAWATPSTVAQQRDTRSDEAARARAAPVEAVAHAAPITHEVEAVEDIGRDDALDVQAVLRTQQALVGKALFSDHDADHAKIERIRTIRMRRQRHRHDQGCGDRASTWRRVFHAGWGGWRGRCVDCRRHLPERDRRVVGPPHGYEPAVSIERHARRTPPESQGRSRRARPSESYACPCPYAISPRSSCRGKGKPLKEAAK
jgi:hypothetical protein